MEPMIPDASKVEFDRSAPIVPGDVVLIIRKPGTYQAGDHQMLVKALLGDTRHVPGGGLTVAMINPPRSLFFAREHVLDVIKCRRLVDKDQPRRILTAGELLAGTAEKMAGCPSGSKFGRIVKQ